MRSVNEIGTFYVDWDESTYGKRADTHFVINHIMSELGEVFTCVRNKEKALYFDASNNFKPEGLGPELADVIILTAKLAALHGIDLERMIKLKHDYNLTRPAKATGE
jgi:NTP pyrophosphatase (non-canonical NTP hydrolase)